MSRSGVILRLAALPALLFVILFGSAGRLNIPAFWAYIALATIVISGCYVAAGPELMRERMKPAAGGKDHLLRRLAAPLMIAHLSIAGLDVGRFHWSDTVPAPLQIAAFAAYAACMSIWVTSMRQNRYFSSVIRIQRDRGHKLIDTGLYSIVRHPGYAAALTTYIWSGLALGSWCSLILSVAMTSLFARRIVLEDRTLQEELDGYREYATRVRYKVLPGVW